MCCDTQEVHLYVDYKSDESYTPSRLSIRAGSAHHDLKVREGSRQQATGRGRTAPKTLPTGKKSSSGETTRTRLSTALLHPKCHARSNVRLCVSVSTQDICIVELREPSGWVKVPLAQPTSGGDQRPAVVQAFFFQVGGRWQRQCSKARN